MFLNKLSRGTRLTIILVLVTFASAIILVGGIALVAREPTERPSSRMYLPDWDCNSPVSLAHTGSPGGFYTTYRKHGDGDWYLYYLKAANVVEGGKFRSEHCRP